MGNIANGVNSGTPVTSGAPAAHAASHTDGTDDIQNATNAQKGLATAAQITRLEALDQAIVLKGT
jgi:hypothetical protein